jgi:uncharacterized protein (DUF58 family)
MSEPAATPKVVAYATLIGIGLLAGVVFGNVAIVALAAPFGFALVIGLLAPVAPLRRFASPSTYPSSSKAVGRRLLSNSPRRERYLAAMSRSVSLPDSGPKNRPDGRSASTPILLSRSKYRSPRSATFGS